MSYLDLNRSSCMTLSGQGTWISICLLSQAALSQGVKMSSEGSSDSVGLIALGMEVWT